MNLIEPDKRHYQPVSMFVKKVYKITKGFNLSLSCGVSISTLWNSIKAECRIDPRIDISEMKVYDTGISGGGDGGCDGGDERFVGLKGLGCVFAAYYVEKLTHYALTDSDSLIGGKKNIQSASRGYWAVSVTWYIPIVGYFDAYYQYGYGKYPGDSSYKLTN